MNHKSVHCMTTHTKKPKQSIYTVNAIVILCAIFSWLVVTQDL